MAEKYNDDARVEEDETLAWKLIESESIVHDAWIDFRRQTYEFPDGKTFSPFYNYSRRDYVVVVALDEDGQYLAVRQFRHGIRQVTVEFCAGGIEKGEDPLDAAKRELQEETGYCSEDWTPLLSIVSEATLADNHAHLFLAQNCKKVSGQSLDETEFLHTRVYSEAYIQKAIMDGTFAQAMHVLAYYMAKEKQNHD